MDGRLLDAFAAALDRLEGAEERQDEDGVWAATREALNWLYACEEALKAGDDYYARRDGSEAGQTVAGLVWVRGLVVHHQADVRRLMWLKTRTFVKVDGEMKPARTYIKINGQMKETTPRVATARWPEVNFLPESTKPTRGRDSMYEEHVAGKRLMPPLQTAQAFFVGEA